MELGYILLVLFHDIIKKGMVNLLKKQLTANEIRYRTYFPELTEKNFNPMNDVLFKFIFGRPERKLITIDFLMPSPLKTWAIRLRTSSLRRRKTSRTVMMKN